jgi:hypothetical protein
VANDPFGSDPCHRVQKSLAVDVSCREKAAARGAAATAAGASAAAGAGAAATIAGAGASDGVIVTGGFTDGLGISHASMQATIFPTMAGAVDDAEIPGMMAAVVAGLKAKGMACSCMAAFWLLEGLYRMGRAVGGEGAAAHALDVLTDTGEHSWMNMIKQVVRVAAVVYGVLVVVQKHHAKRSAIETTRWALLLPTCSPHVLVVCVFVDVRACVCALALLFACVYACVCVCACECVRVCAYVYVNVCVCARVTGRHKHHGGMD